MARKQRKCDMEYKIKAVKAGKGTWRRKAAAELGIPKNAMYAWTKAARKGRLELEMQHLCHRSWCAVRAAGFQSGHYKAPQGHMAVAEPL